MKISLLKSNAFLLLAFLVLSACSNHNSNANDSNSTSRNSGQNSAADTLENTNATRDDIDELGRIIKLPVIPEEATYWEENAAKPNDGNQSSVASDKKIVAVLKYSPENSSALVNQIEKIKPPVDSEIETESQFPAELIAQSQLSGDESLKGKAYAADNFFQTPYTSGKITRINDSDYFVLELTAK